MLLILCTRVSNIAEQLLAVIAHFNSVLSTELLLRCLQQLGRRNEACCCFNLWHYGNQIRVLLTIVGGVPRTFARLWRGIFSCPLFRWGGGLGVNPLDNFSKDGISKYPFYHVFWFIQNLFLKPTEH